MIMTFKFQYLFLLPLCLLLNKSATAQTGSSLFSLHFGLERSAESYLWPNNAQGHYLGLQYERRLPYRFGVGLGFSHHFVTDGSTGNIYNDGLKYLLITQDKPYQYQSAQDVANLQNNGVKRLPDHLNKVNSFKLEAEISYDILKSQAHDLQLVGGGNLNISSSTWHTDDWAGIFTSPGLTVDTVRYIVPYEQRALGFGAGFSIKYRYIFNNGLALGVQIGENYLFTNNGGIYNTIGLFIGKRFNKK